jgi:hypothetical protein
MNTLERMAAGRLNSPVILLVLSITLSAKAQVEADFRWKAELYTDIRTTICGGELAPCPTNVESFDYERFETGIRGEVLGKYGGWVLGKAQLDILYLETGQTSSFSELLDRNQLDPFRIESRALFVTFTDAGADGLDISLGRKQLVWGASDKFRPTSNLVPLDVQDPLAFGDTVAQEMVHIRYSPYVFGGDEDDPWFDELFFEVAWVPLFKPAWLPSSAEIAFSDVNEQFRNARTPILASMANDQVGYVQQGSEVSVIPTIVRPDFDIQHSMIGARMGFNLGGVDMSFSYFYGYDDFPRAEEAVVTGNTIDVNVDLTLSYPKVHVVGIDMATSLDFLDGVGLWAEVAFNIHDDLYITIDGTEFAGNGQGQVFQNGPELELEKGFFIKATVGMDYTPFPWWYINVQYLRGFVDEFGANKLGDYLVAGMDFKMLRDKLLLRIFGLVKFPVTCDTDRFGLCLEDTGPGARRRREDASAAIFPQIVVAPVNGAEFTVGAFLYFGARDTKFGSPTTGASTVFARARILF